MLRYSLYKPKIIKFCAIMLTICIGFTIYVVVDIFTLRSYQDNLDYISSNALAQLYCSQLCEALPEETMGNCCNFDHTLCQPKQTCYESTVSNYQTLVNKTSDYIYYFSIPAIFFFVAFLIALAYCLILRKRSLQEEYRIALQQILLANQQANQQGNAFQDSLDDQDMIQYMLQYGYLYQTKKKGDKKITDSFVTVDENACPICMMDFREEKVLKLNCQHKFHSSCIRDWNQANSSCPICRADIYD